MRCGIPRILTVAAVVAWAALLRLSGRDGSEFPARENGPAKPVLQRHFVSPDQLVECGALAEKRIEPCSAVAHNERHRSAWPGAGGARPLVLVFIKRDCPCQRRIRALLPPTRDALPRPRGLRRRHRRRRGPGPCLCGGQQGSLSCPRRSRPGDHHRLEAKHGGYVALLGVNGHLDTLWPGCSAEMMQALGRRIAALNALAERPLDVSGMPKVLTTGCPFPL